VDDHFDIAFDTNGTQFTAKVYPKFEEMDVYFQVDFKFSDQREADGVLFVEMNNSGEWVQKQGTTVGWQIKNELLEQIGSAIESNGS
jgi:hypothetical protein